MQYLLVIYICGCMYEHLGLFVLFWQHAYGKLSMLVHSQEGLCFSDIINKECILEDVHLWRDLFTLYNECTILD